MILTMAAYDCRHLAIQKMNAAVTDDMTAESLLFDGLYQIERDPQGAVLAVTGDAAAINQVKAHLTQQVAAALDQLREQTFYVPVLGAYIIAIGTNLLTLYVSSVWGGQLMFLLVLLFIVFRTQGLVGKKLIKKV